jgi:DNA-binding response OmpR family regulator
MSITKNETKRHTSVHSAKGDPRNRILIVEDDLATLYALERLFRSQGWSVRASRTVEEALAQLDVPPNWIVLDLELPDGSGEEVLRHVRDSRSSARVAVVSGTPELDSLPSLKPLKPDVVMAKPIHFEDLLAACDIS